MQLLDRDELLLQARDLQPLPATVTRLATLVSDPNAEIADLVEVISLDPALTVRLLRVANSAAAGTRSEVTTVERAVVRLGTGAVLSMAVAAGVKGRMMAAIPAYGLEAGQLWEHSVAAALAAESMPGLVRPAPPPEAFTAALLHDIGRLILARCVDDQILDFLARARQEGGRAELAQAEAEVLEVDHAELGGRVADHWQLPRSIGVGIEFHHRPRACPEGEGWRWMPWYVRLADLVARRLGYALEETPVDDGDLAEAMEMLGLDESQLEKLLYRTSLRLDQIHERFS